MAAAHFLLLLLLDLIPKPPHYRAIIIVPTFLKSEKDDEISAI